MQRQLIILLMMTTTVVPVLLEAQQKNETTRVLESSTPEMIYVKGGHFNMGSDKAYSDETPIHKVTISDFYIGKYEITFAQYDAYCELMKKSKPSPETLRRGNLPVIGVSWYDAVAFCKWLSQETKRHYRLPTEAEWEYAAKGGDKSKGYRYSGSNNIDDVAWGHNNANDQSHIVGHKQCNELGLYDMSGNVGEWCSDRYGNYNIKDSINPQGPSSGSRRVYRGGNWFLDDNKCCSSARNFRNPKFGVCDLGFRIVEDSMDEYAVPPEKENQQ